MLRHSLAKLLGSCAQLRYAVYEFSTEKTIRLGEVNVATIKNPAKQHNVNIIDFYTIRDNNLRIACYLLVPAAE